MKAYKMLSVIFAVMVIWGGSVFADTLDDAGKNIEGRINAFRESPYQNIMDFAAAGGISQADLPLWVESLKGIRLGSLSVNHSVGQAAASHALDMIAKNYISTVNPEGLDHSGRLVVAGYNHVASSEVMGLVMFRNFLPIDAGMETIFKNMLLNDLGKTDINNTVIFNPVARDFAVSVQVGPMFFDSKQYNVYLAVCDAGLSEQDVNMDKASAAVSEIENMLVVLMNQARIEPLRSAGNMQIDRNLISAITPEFFLTGQGAPALIRTNLENVKNCFYGLQTLEESGNEVNPIPIAAQSLFVEANSFKNAAESTNIIFRKILEAEIAAFPFSRIIYNPLIMKYSPLSIDLTVSKNVLGQVGFNVNMSILPLCENSLQGYIVSGAIYNDADGDGLYDAGEKTDGSMNLEVFLPHWHQIKEFDSIGGFMGIYDVWPSAIFIEHGDNRKWYDVSARENGYTLINIDTPVHDELLQ